MKKILLLSLFLFSISTVVFGQITTLSCIDNSNNSNISLELKTDRDSETRGLVIINGTRMNEGTFTRTTITWSETIDSSVFTSVLNRLNGILTVGITPKDNPKSFQGSFKYQCSQQSRKF